MNYLITINFHGFKLLVNKLHGVYMQVDHRYINTVGGPGGYAKIDLEPGYQKLDGQEALDFVRFRHTDSDVYRLARQQLFLEALKDRMSSSLSLTSLPGVIGALKNNVEMARGGGGAPGLSEILAYAGLAYHLGGGHLFRVSIPNLVDCGYLNAQVCTQPSDIQTAVTSFTHPDVSLPDRAGSVAAGIKPKQLKQPKLKRAAITTLVLNGTTQAGLARDTSYKLGLAGVPHRPAAADDPGRRADPELRQRRSSTTTRCSRTPRRPRSRCWLPSARTRVSRRSRPGSRRSRRSRATR